MSLVEKYRPKSLNDYVTSDAYKEMFEGYIGLNEIPHMLLHSLSPGSGKTTLAKILVKEIDCDSIFIHGSKERGIDTVRDKIDTFISTRGFSKFKIVVIDEFDKFTTTGQEALLSIMEDYYKYSRFILTCNDINKVVSTIKSRCSAGTFHLQPPSRTYVARKLSEICKSENIKYTLDDIKYIVETTYPDIRRAIGNIERFNVNGSIKIESGSIKEADYMDSIVDVFMSGKSAKDMLSEVRNIIKENSNSDFSELYRYLYKRIDDYGVGYIAPIIVELDEAQYKDSFVVDKQIHVVRVLIEIIKIIKG